MNDPDQTPDEALYESFYGPPKLPELTPENEDLYNALFKGQDN